VTIESDDFRILLKSVTMIALELMFLSALMQGPATAQTADWSKSPEAYFLTSEERQAWNGLRSDDARQQFRVTWWKRRDPTPGTDRNEFQELVLGRIRRADAEFTIGKTPGSRSAQGLVYIVLGPPSARQQTIGPILVASGFSWTMNSARACTS
jgi:GWxTD domain-containing protein